MENGFIQSLEIPDNFTRNICCFMVAFFKGLISSTICIHFLQKIDKVVVYSETSLYAGIDFMNTHNWKRSILIANMELIGFYIGNYSGFHSVFLRIFLIVMNMKFPDIQNFILTKCINIIIMYVLGLSSDVMMLFAMVIFICHYIFEYQHKDVNDFSLGLTLCLFLTVYFNMKLRAYALKILYAGTMHWILFKTDARDLWTNGHLQA